jgi:hypothetical protein
MFDTRRVKEEVAKLRLAIGLGQAADAFPIWYLHRKFQIPRERAQMQAADPAHEGVEKGYDFGVDAYHIDLRTAEPRLWLIQAKYSESLQSVGLGYKDLMKSTRLLHQLVDGHGLEARENKIIGNLRADLSRLPDDVRARLKLDFVVLHLADDDDEVISLRTTKARELLDDALQDTFADRLFTISQIGPHKLDFPDAAAEVVNIPKEWLPLTLTAVTSRAKHDDRDVEMVFGVGRLGELVELYRSRRDLLFSRNVRSFLQKKSNLDKGPAGKIRTTLKEICVDKTREPELFAFFHNGVTMSAEQLQDRDGGYRVREPYVLNGCQTIKTAFLFESDPLVKSKIDRDRWNRISIPVRVTIARDEELVRTITINTNRQNSISPAALHANDPIQLKLQDRFQRAGIYYERQEGAFDSLRASGEDIDQYEHSQHRAVRIQDLARCLAAVAGRTDLFHFAHHQNDLFESNDAYRRCFSPERTASVSFMVFLQNLHDVLPLVLKKDLSLEPSPGAPLPHRLTYYAMCLLCRFLAKEKRLDAVREYGIELWGRHKTFRDQVASWCSNHQTQSRIKSALSERFMKLSDSKAKSLQHAFAQSEASLRLGSQVDPFDTFAELDDSGDRS